MIFETSRLYVRPLEENDQVTFFDLMSNPKVMSLIPQKPFNEKESAEKLNELILLEKASDTKIWALCGKEDKTFIGICGVLKNNAQEDEIAYRILETQWNRGYGTEVTKGLLNYCFEILKSELVTADVYIENHRSVKILNKFFEVQKEFFNAEDKCTDRRYSLRRENWKNPAYQKGSL